VAYFRGVEKSYWKEMNPTASGTVTTYRCTACGGRFDHDSAKYPSRETWLTKTIAKCRVLSKEAAASQKGKGKSKGGGAKPKGTGKKKTTIVIK
jgi:hypothetical protein